MIVFCHVKCAWWTSSSALLSCSRIKVDIVNLTQQQFVAVSVVQHYFFLIPYFFASFLKLLCRKVCVTSPTLVLTSSGLNVAYVALTSMSVTCIVSEFNPTSKTPKSVSSKAHASVWHASPSCTLLLRSPLSLDTERASRADVRVLTESNGSSSSEGNKRSQEK